MDIQKPEKKGDAELFQLLGEKLNQGAYFFSNHAKQRLAERKIYEYEVLDILKGKPDKKRRRRASKEKYTEEYNDWNYCVEGLDDHGDRLRVVFSFSETNTVVITVIRINLKWWKNNYEDKDS